jgi:hypothetical protein
MAKTSRKKQHKDTFEFEKFSVSAIQKFVDFCKSKGYNYKIPGELTFFNTKNGQAFNLVDENTIRKLPGIVDAEFTEEVKEEIVKKEEVNAENITT